MELYTVDGMSPSDIWDRMESIKKELNEPYEKLKRENPEATVFRPIEYTEEETAKREELNKQMKKLKSLAYSNPGFFDYGLLVGGVRLFLSGKGGYDKREEVSAIMLEQGFHTDGSGCGLGADPYWDLDYTLNEEESKRLCRVAYELFGEKLSTGNMWIRRTPDRFGGWTIKEPTLSVKRWDKGIPEEEKVN